MLANFLILMVDIYNQSCIVFLTIKGEANDKHFGYHLSVGY